MRWEPTKNEAVLSDEAVFREAQRKAVVERAVKLHTSGESHAVIMRRLNITRPTLVAYLREAGLDGHSARPSVDERGGVAHGV